MSGVRYQVSGVRVLLAPGTWRLELDTSIAQRLRDETKCAEGTLDCGGSTPPFRRIHALRGVAKRHERLQ